MVDKAAEDFADAYTCVFTRCSGFQSPLPFTRIACRGDAILTTVATLGPCAAPAVDRLLRFDMSRVNACASLWHLCDSAWKPVALEPAAYRQLVVAPKLSSSDVCGVVATSPRGGSSATFFCQNDGEEAVKRTIENVTCIAADTQRVWWAGKDAAGENRLWCSDYETVLAAQTMDVGTETVISSSPRGILAVSPTSVLVYGVSGLHGVDLRAPTFSVSEESGIRSASLVGDHGVVAHTECNGLVVLDLRKVSAGEPLLNKSLSVPVRICGHRGLHCALLVSHSAVAVLDVCASAMVGAMDCTEGHFLDAELLECHGRTARVCAATSTGMLFDYTMTY